MKEKKRYRFPLELDKELYETLRNLIPKMQRGAFVRKVLLETFSCLEEFPTTRGQIIGGLMSGEVGLSLQFRERKNSEIKVKREEKK